jgi:hypothetical protein
MVEQSIWIFAALAHDLKASGQIFQLDKQINGSCENNMWYVTRSRWLTICIYKLGVEIISAGRMGDYAKGCEHQHPYGINLQTPDRHSPPGAEGCGHALGVDSIYEGRCRDCPVIPSKMMKSCTL